MRVSNGFQISVGLIGVALYIGAASYAAYHGFRFYLAHDRHARWSEVLEDTDPTLATEHDVYVNAKTIFNRCMMISCVTFGLGFLCTITARRIQSERWPFREHAEDSSVQE